MVPVVKVVGVAAPLALPPRLLHLLVLVLGPAAGLLHPLLKGHHFILDCLVEGQLLADQLLDALVQLDVVLRHEGDGLPRPARPRRPAHAVDVVLRGRETC